MTGKTAARADRLYEVIANRWGFRLADLVAKGVRAGRLVAEVLAEYNYQGHGLRMADLS